MILIGRNPITRVISLTQQERRQGQADHTRRETNLQERDRHICKVSSGKKKLEISVGGETGNNKHQHGRNKISTGCYKYFFASVKNDNKQIVVFCVDMNKYNWC